MTNNYSVREIICFNDDTLFMALKTNKIISISKVGGKDEYLETELCLDDSSVRNLILVKGCIIAQEVSLQDEPRGLCRFVPRVEASNDFLKEVSSISDCEILL